MSAIAGIYHLDGRPADRIFLDRMVQHVASWPADNRGVWANGPVGFGHRMLHDTPKSLHERLLLSYRDGVVITADARIDNRQELLAEFSFHEGNISTVTDDLARVQMMSGLPHVYPGYPMIKMKPRESSMLGFPGHCNRPLHEKEQKYGCCVHVGFTTLPCPLSHIFILAVDPERGIQRLSKKESFIELIKNSAPPIWDLLPDELHFSHIEELIEKMPVSILKREQCLEALPEYAGMIEEYLQQGKGRNSTQPNPKETIRSIGVHPCPDHVFRAV